MLLDAHDVPVGTEIQTGLCIIGAGAAGLTLAQHFAERQADVCLLESGGLTFDPAIQALYRGESVGQPYTSLEACRHRFFGGSTNCWTGWCRPLDPIDFEPREGVPHGGWPFTRADLDPYYARAQALCQLADRGYNGETWTRPDRPALPMDPGRVRTDVFQFSPPTRFGQVYKEPIRKAARVQAILHATVTEIEPDASAQTIRRVHVRNLAGHHFTVAARAIVLATGGIENARMLLLSNRVTPEGLANTYDVVGRSFMEHPHMLNRGLCRLSPPEGFTPGLYDEETVGGSRIRGMLHLPEPVLRKYRLQNYTGTLYTVTKDEAPKRECSELMKAVFEAIPHRWSDQPDPRQAYVAVLGNRVEQRPNAMSRVMLSDQLDALGQRRVKLDWRLTEEDRQSYRMTQRLIGEELGRAGLGRLRMGLGDDEPWTPTGGPHHMGTTRMHRDPHRGVVDANGRAHGLDNLYIAGSSVFPSSGAANPTLTIVALALRLAKHLEGKLS